MLRGRQLELIIIELWNREFKGKFSWCWYHSTWWPAWWRMRLSDSLVKGFRLYCLFCLCLFSRALCLALFGCFLPFSLLHKIFSPQAFPNGESCHPRRPHLCRLVWITDPGWSAYWHPPPPPPNRGPCSRGSSALFSLFPSFWHFLLDNPDSREIFCLSIGPFPSHSWFLYCLGSFYFLPAKTTFYFVIPNAKETWAGKLCWL